METIYTNDYNQRKISLLQNGLEIGYFQVYFGPTTDMTIYLNDEYRGKGLAKYMIGELLKRWYSEDPYVRKDKFVFIDADASEGFWDKIGMIDNRYYLSERSLEGKGYEKVITFAKLAKWALGYPLGI